jgi:PPE-repeat protein
MNTGNKNTGDGNTGYWNTGNKNSGDRNTGDGNTGDGNTGYCNSGYWNSGYCNSGDRNSGMFCSIEPTLIIFNKPSNKKWSEIDHPHFNEFYLTKWVEYSDLTAAEKKENPSCETTRGLLKSFTYKEAWATFWKETDEGNRQKFLALPNFDAVLFEEITGINVKENSKLVKAL